MTSGRDAPPPDGATDDAGAAPEAPTSGGRDGAVYDLRDVRKSYDGTRALDGVDLRVDPGERVALAGPSGAGKSTLIALMNGSLAPTSGRVRVFGRDVADLSVRELRRLQRRIGTVHQQFHLVDNLRVVHNVNAGRLGEWSTARAAVSLLRPLGVDRARGVLERVGIGDKLFQRTESLSGGEQQRVALSRVLAQDPEVVLADEPISSLDRENSREVMDLLRDLAREEGKTLVVSLHEWEYALSHCERVVGIRAGRVLFDRPADAVDEAEVEALYRLER